MYTHCWARAPRFAQPTVLYRINYREMSYVNLRETLQTVVV